MSFDPIAYINEPRWLESRLGLERIAELLDRLDRPQDRLKFVHVAGTNGKGVDLRLPRLHSAGRGLAHGAVHQPVPYRVRGAHPRGRGEHLG